MAGDGDMAAAAVNLKADLACPLQYNTSKWLMSQYQRKYLNERENAQPM